MGLTEADVEAAVEGRPAALEAVYRELAPRVQRYLRARGADDPEALTNDVFLTVLGRLDRLDGGLGGLRRFVFSVAHARYVDDVRRKARRPLHVVYDSATDTRHSPGAETTVMDSLGGGEAHALLARLGDDQREVLSLRVLGGLSLEETARVMERSVGAVKQLQRRGILALREILEQGGGRSE